MPADRPFFSPIEICLMRVEMALDGIDTTGLSAQRVAAIYVTRIGRGEN